MLKEFLEDILDYLEDNFKYDLAMLVVLVFGICMAYAAMNGIYTYADKKCNNGYTTEQRWEMAEELKENYTIYVDGEKKNKDFNIDGLSHAKYGIEINIDKKQFIFIQQDKSQVIYLLSCLHSSLCGRDLLEREKYENMCNWSQTKTLIWL